MKESKKPKPKKPRKTLGEKFLDNDCAVSGHASSDEDIFDEECDDFIDDTDTHTDGLGHVAQTNAIIQKEHAHNKEKLFQLLTTKSPAWLKKQTGLAFNLTSPEELLQELLN